MGLFGPPDIEKMKARSDIPGLENALRNRNAGTRLSAARALGELKSGRSVELLLPLLSDEDGRVREAAVRSLGSIANARAVEALNFIINEHQTRERGWGMGGISFSETDAVLFKCIPFINSIVCTAITALQMTGDPHKIPTLWMALAFPATEEVARQALLQIGLPAVEEGDEKDRLFSLNINRAPVVETFLTIITPNFHRLSDTTLMVLMSFLGSEEKKIRIQVAETIVKIFRSSETTDVHKKLLLKSRKLITGHHDHSDVGPDECYSKIPHPHTDQGAGIDFPL